MGDPYSCSTMILIKCSRVGSYSNLNLGLSERTISLNGPIRISVNEKHDEEHEHPDSLMFYGEIQSHIHAADELESSSPHEAMHRLCNLWTSSSINSSNHCKPSATGGLCTSRGLSKKGGSRSRAATEGP